MVFAIKESQNIDVLSITGLKGKLQAQEERVNVIQEDVGAQSLFQSKMVLHISKGVEDMDTIEEKEQEIDLEIQDLGMTKQKLNVSIIRKWVIMFGIAGIQTEGLRRMSILL
jgi:hypothetical protein